VNFVLRDAQSGYDENALVHPGKLSEEGVSKKDAAARRAPCLL